MRLRKVKGASEKICESRYIINNPKNYKGKYRTIFNNENPLYIEIGMGKGDFIINNAIKYPNINFIGIEKYDSVLVRAIEKLEEMNLTNLRLIMYDANDIDEIFDREVDILYLNFSDPWPKKRHASRRLTSPVFLEKYDKIFKKKKEIIQKTDNRKLFEYSIYSYIDHGYKINNISLDLYDDNIKDNIPTEYEIKFNEKGQTIYMIDVIM